MALLDRGNLFKLQTGDDPEEKFRIQDSEASIISATDLWHWVWLSNQTFFLDLFTKKLIDAIYQHRYFCVEVIRKRYKN